MADPRQIVVVEDVFVRTFLKAAFERLGHTTVCTTRVEAIRLLQGGRIDLLVTNTPQDFAEFGESVRLLYLAAFPDPVAAAAFRVWLSLRKPFQTAELASAVEHLFETR
jgi:hypothetical protein